MCILNVIWSEKSSQKMLVWRNILKLVHSLLICATHCLLQQKELHGSIFTRAKLAKILYISTTVMLVMSVSNLQLMISKCFRHAQS